MYLSNSWKGGWESLGVIMLVSFVKWRDEIPRINRGKAEERRMG